MTWFKVDDTFHSHPKVLAASPAALGLWVVAGSWSGANLSDGFVPDHALPRLLPDSATLARELVTAGLWKRARGGYRFHDWGDFNPTAATVQTERQAARERMRAVRARRKGTSNEEQRSHFKQGLKEGRENDEDATTRAKDAGSRTNGSAEQQANVRGVFAYPDPTRPEVLLGGALRDPLTPAPAQRQSPPNSRCEEHRGMPEPPPCGRCADARRAREAWDLADATRRRTQAQCRVHRGQPAGQCGLCRADRIATKEAN